MRPIVWTLVEIAKVGVGGDDSRHRTDIKTKQASSHHCHCSDTAAKKSVNGWVVLADSFILLNPQREDLAPMTYT
jgi:hypothetical protein